MFCAEEAFEDLEEGTEIFGLSSLRPFDGESAENRWWVSGGATEETDATEPVEDFRRPVKDIESRLALRGRMLADEVAADA